MGGTSCQSARARRPSGSARGLAAWAVITIVCVAALAGCAIPGAPTLVTLEAQYRAGQVHAVARIVLRILGRDRRHIGVLFLTEMSGPDAPGPPYPRCIRRHPAGDRVVSFDLNYHPRNMGPGTAPAVHVTLAGPTGVVMTVESHTRPDGTWACAAARHLYLSREQAGWQLVYGLALPVPVDAALHALKLHVDGKALTAHFGKVYTVRLTHRARA